MYLVEKHTKFVEDIYTSSKLDKNPYSCIPSVIFLSCTFVVLYMHIHQYQSRRWGEGIYKDVVFHWAYFYIARIWFVFVKFGRYLIDSMDEFVEENSPKDEIILNQTLTHVCIFLITLTISTIPLIIISFQQIYRDRIPNLLMWITEEDPQTNSELGTSGQYLERPPHFLQPYRKDAVPYRSKRSTSFIADVLSDRQTSNCRISKSLMTISSEKFQDNLPKRY
ncbi:uncharacterized protein LOC130895085 isoform X1 [Diorhabda carinulata]|uniref:uncharacterized protein LOC130895085 isoform X1 n=1 Tax=Diorhabda carinulata TaxID=1163345 RepID=UPI0025A2F4B6|nr:uncharacterized protein LOC130895085 isoform X1 [Diorhabda carinulata]